MSILEILHEAKFCSTIKFLKVEKTFYATFCANYGILEITYQGIIFFDYQNIKLSNTIEEFIEKEDYILLLNFRINEL